MSNIRIQLLDIINREDYNSMNFIIAKYILENLGKRKAVSTKESYLEGNEYSEIISSDIWYEERTDFSRAAIGTDRIAHREERGFELLQGSEVFQGELLGGCLESLYDILTATRYADEKAVCEKYGLFPDQEEWAGKILFIETCEEKPAPELVEKELTALKDKGVFDVVSGVLVGKPQDEAYYEEYKEVLTDDEILKDYDEVASYFLD